MNSVSASTQPEVRQVDILLMIDKINNLRLKKEKLEKQIAAVLFTEESFIYDDKKTRFFTGLSSYKILLLIHKTIAPDLYT